MLRRALFLIAIALWSVGSEGIAENPKPPSGRPALTGEVGYSDPDAKGRNRQLEEQDTLELWSNQIQSAVKKGGEGSVQDLSGETAAYLSVLYFYCTVKEGPCPFVFETILDAELIHAKAGKGDSCQSMKRFFKGFLANGLDDRGKFMYPLTRGLEMAGFNTDVRPRFLDCTETVAAMLEDKEVLAQRFGDTGTSLESLAKFNTLLKQVKDQKIDIYVATGLSAEK